MRGEKTVKSRSIASYGGSVLPLGDQGVMTKDRVKRLARLATGALLLLVVQAVVAPRSAWAGCSHPASAHVDPFVDLYPLDSIFMAGFSSDSPDGSSRSPVDLPARHSPCSGLSCSTRDPLPISTASPGLESSHQWGATLGALIDLDTQSSTGRTFDEPAPIAVGEKTSIFHPPRV
jgi:hypothetical protein